MKRRGTSGAVIGFWLSLVGLVMIIYLAGYFFVLYRDFLVANLYGNYSRVPDFVKKWDSLLDTITAFMPPVLLITLAISVIVTMYRKTREGEERYYY